VSRCLHYAENAKLKIKVNCIRKKSTKILNLRLLLFIILSFYHSFVMFKKKKKSSVPYEIAALPLSPKDGHHGLCTYFIRYIQGI
jgi:hypothetical protein